MIAASSSFDGVWQAVDALIDRAPSAADLQSHGLHLLAARRWRARGLVVPAEMVAEEQAAAVRWLAAPLVLERVARAAREPLVLFKGASVAASYPDARLRPFFDIDVLAVHAERVHRRLRDAGFAQLGPSSHYDGRHHLAPLVLPRLPIPVEVHRRPEWGRWSTPPSARSIIEVAEPAPFGIDGILSPKPADHALLVAAHSWATLPLRRILDLLDVFLLAAAAGRDAVREQARKWRVERVWLATIRAADALLAGETSPISLRTWARALQPARELTVLESHIRRLASPIWALPPHRATAAVLAALAREFVPGPDDMWASKAARIGAAVRRPGAPKSEHDRAVEHRERELRATHRGTR